MDLTSNSLKVIENEFCITEKTEVKVYMTFTQLRPGV